jgi:hypothetical protein
VNVDVQVSIEDLTTIIGGLAQVDMAHVCEKSIECAVAWSGVLVPCGVVVGMVVVVLCCVVL